jgi:hypothetical protein
MAEYVSFNDKVKMQRVLYELCLRIVGFIDRTVARLFTYKSAVY